MTANRDITPPSTAAGAPTGSILLVDGHVHFYPCFEVEAFLEGAFRNFADAARKDRLRPGAPGCLLFTEVADHDWFRTFMAMADARSETLWSFRRTDEDCSLLACRAGQPALLLIAGRQIATAERLEVLSLASISRVPDGLSLQATVEFALAGGGVPVLPWAFGKWWWLTPRKLQQVARAIEPHRLYLGDNGGRPQWMPPPRLFRWAYQERIPILAGTDPLPFASQARRAGGYGFLIDGALDGARPAAGLRRLLQQAAQPRCFGRRTPFAGFVRDQIALRVARPGGTA